MRNGIEEYKQEKVTSGTSVSKSVREIILRVQS